MLLLLRYEAGGAAVVMGVPSFPIPNLPDGTIPIDALAAAIKPDDPHFPTTGLVCLENSQNRCGGAALPNEYVADVAAFCREHSLPLHVDGARLLNAVQAVGTTPEVALEGVDSASVCLSKGLGAPVGSVVVGDAAFIRRARRLRKMVGGGMRQAGVIAAAGRVALNAHYEGLAADNELAKALARGLLHIPGVQVSSPGFDVMPGGLDSVHTNIVYFSVPQELGPRAAERIVATLRADHNILLGEYGSHLLRAVTHHQVSAADVNTCVDAVAATIADMRA